MQMIMSTIMLLAGIGTRYPWWVRVLRNFLPIMDSEYVYGVYFSLVGIDMALCTHWVPYPLSSLVVVQYYILPDSVYR